MSLPCSKERLEIEGPGGKSDPGEAGDGAGRVAGISFQFEEGRRRSQKEELDHPEERWSIPPKLQRACGYFALKTKLIGVASFPVMVISCVCVPRVSCHAVSVYFPGGKLGNVKVPSSPVTE